ncbi:MAG: BTAD domain-containing putative transcriptional regulator [Acidimicrobiales bacterium]
MELRVRLLGGLDVAGLEAKDVGSRKARTLLAALAVADGQPFAADALAELLWGEDLPAKPTEQVGVLVSRLRGVLGGDRIVRHDAGYSLVADWIDQRDLDDGVAAAEQAATRGDAVSARMAATMALDLVRGPLLPEESAPWFDAPRRATERKVAATRLLVAEAALVSGDPAGAAAMAARSLDHDPYDEAALRSLMRAHVALGRPASALGAYAEVRGRLAEELGVSPAVETEALHAEVLAVPDAAAPASPPAVPERWDPLVQRARAELAGTDFDAARRDAEAAVRRGAGAGALEVAGWAAYYDHARDIDGALRFAEEALRAAADDERRTSALTLSGRVRHSRGDLLGAERDLEEAVRSPVAGVRGTGEVWLGALRMHQGRFDEAIERASRGAIDAAAMRHPFVIPHSMFARAYSLGAMGRVAEVLDALSEFDALLEDLGPVGARYQPVVDNLWGWILCAVGRTDEGRARNRRALDRAGRFSEPRHHALLDLALHALDADDATAARSWLTQLEVPPDEAGAMAWHQRQRQRLLEARACLLDHDPAGARRLASWVRDDARLRGARRAALQADLVHHLAAAQAGVPDTAGIDAAVLALDELARLEAWRWCGQLGAATGRDDLWAAAEQHAQGLATASGPGGDRVRSWTAAELARLGRPQR